MSGTGREEFDVADLHAWADGQLEPARHDAMRAWLESNPETAAEVAGWQHQNEALVEMFGGAAAPSAADAAMVAGLARPRPARRWRMAAAAAALFVAGGIARMTLDSLQGGGGPHYAQSLPEASRNNYLIYASEIKHPVEVEASQEAHLVKWMSNRLGMNFKAPDLSAQGFDLVGGRLVPYAGEPGAMLMYENGAGERVTVMTGTNSEHRGTSFRFERENGVSTFYWVDGDFGYALSGAISREALLDLANEIYRQT
jgi:anti-sigma factor RsiW